MKTLTNILGASLATLGVLAIVGVASAATTDQLQPAGDITYTETVIVPSIKVGAQGVGGVTFFNGTIVNSTTNSGANNPVTFGDDVRIDGQIYRTEVGGANPLKLADSIRPQTTNAYDLGSSTYRFKDGYFAGDLNVGGTVDGVDVSAIPSTYLPLAGGVLTGTVNVSGDIVQNVGSDGAVKGWAYVSANGTLWAGYNSNSVTRTGVGQYEVNFNFAVNDGSGRATRGYSATASGENGVVDNGTVGVGPDSSNPPVVVVNTENAAGNLDDGAFMITVF